MADLFDFAKGHVPSTQQLADDGMQRAVEHADAVEPAWSERAYQLLLEYAATHFEFMTENVRVWAHEGGFPPPPDPRAWGAVALRAAKAGIMEVERYQKTRIPPAHATPRPLWRSRIYSEAA